MPTTSMTGNEQGENNSCEQRENSVSTNTRVQRFRSHEGKERRFGSFVDEDGGAGLLREGEAGAKGRTVLPRAIPAAGMNWSRL